MKIIPRKKRLHAAARMSPFLAWGDFHARSRFARSTIPEEKWGTTRSLYPSLPYVENRGRLELNWAPRSEKKLLQKVRIKNKRCLVLNRLITSNESPRFYNESSKI